MIVTLATQLPVSQTVDFVERNCPQPGLRLLDVGCGTGELALALKHAGFNVKAIDADADKVFHVEEKGIECALSDISDYEDDPFDVIVFANSFHHLKPLDKAVQKTRSLLKAEGTVLIEDFAPEIADEDTVRFRYETEFILRGSCGLSCNTRDEYPLNPLEHWHEHFFVKHKVSSSATMRDAITKQFSTIEEEAVPYMYRYIVDKLPRRSESLAIAHQVLAEEKELIRRGMIKAIGLRMVGKV